MKEGRQEQMMEGRKEALNWKKNEKEDNEGWKRKRQKAESTGGVTHSVLWLQDSGSGDSAMMQKALVQFEHGPVQYRAHAGQLCPDHLSLHGGFYMSLSPSLSLNHSFISSHFRPSSLLLSFRVWWGRAEAFCCAFPVFHKTYRTDLNTKKKENRKNAVITHKAQIVDFYVSVIV